MNFYFLFYRIYGVNLVFKDSKDNHPALRAPLPEGILGMCHLKQEGSYKEFKDNKDSKDSKDNDYSPTLCEQ